MKLGNWCVGFAVVLLVFMLAGMATATDTFGPETYGFVRAWGSAGSGDGQFNNHLFVATDGSGNVYVSDNGNNRVQKFSSDGVFLTKWKGAGNIQLLKPEGIACDSSGNVYVADSGNHRIVQFNADGTRVLASWGSKGNGNGQFTGPDGIALDASDNVYVTDMEPGLIQKFTSAGVFITKWEMKTSTGQVPKFSNPIGIAVDTSDRLHNTVYVADYNLAYIQKFSPAGDSLAQWGSPGTSNGQFRSPLGLAIDDIGSVFVVEHGGISDDPKESSHVQKFAPSTEYITQWGSTGHENGQFWGPDGIAVDKEGNVFVGDSGNNRIQNFALVKPSLIVKTTPPGAEIYLNHADSGHTTPFTFSDMDPMAITLSMKLAGYEEIVYYSAILRKGRTTTVDLALQPYATQVPATRVNPTPVPAEIIAVSLVSAVICFALFRKRVL